MPTVPQYVSVPWDVDEFVPGGSLPDVLSTGTYITNQTQLDGIIAAAALSHVTLTFSTLPPPGYLAPDWPSGPVDLAPVFTDGTNLFMPDGTQLTFTGGGGGATINDGVTATTSTWSSTRIAAAIVAAAAKLLPKPTPGTPVGYTIAVTDLSGNVAWVQSGSTGGGGGGIGGDAFDLSATNYDEIVVDPSSPDGFNIESDGYDSFTIDPTSTANFDISSNGYDTVVIP